MRWAYGSTPQLVWAHALVLLRMLLFGAVLFGILRPLLTRDVVRRTGGNAELAENAILAVLAIAFVLVFLRGVARVTWKDLGLEREHLERNLAIGVGVFALGLLLVHARVAIAGGELAGAWHAALGYSPRQRLQLLLVGVHVVFGEEILFRGYLQPGLRARSSAPLAIGISAFVFALYHLQFSLAGFVGNFLWGVVWGLARERTKSTVPSSVAHFLNWAVLGWY